MSMAPDDVLKRSGQTPSPSRLLARLSVPNGGLESLGVAGTESGAPSLDSKERIEAATRILKAQSSKVPDIDEAVIDQMIKDAEEALRKLENDGPAAELGESEVFGLEAVIEADGSRPVLFVQDGTIDLEAPALNETLASRWLGAASGSLGQIENVVASVGAVQLPDLDKKRVGTAFAIAPGYVLTNRHVLEEIAVFKDGAWAWKFNAEVDFVGEYQRDGERRFQLGEVVLFGPNAINRMINFSNLDVAVIRVRDNGKEFPRPLSFEHEVDRVKVSGDARQPAIYVVGFPAKPWVLSGNPAGGSPQAGSEYAEVLEKLYANRFGSKRWAPGLVEAGAGQLAGDARKWVMSHDASTLGGNSGSCVVDFDNGGERIVGLHFGGRPRVENYAHVVASLQTELASIKKMVWI